MASHQHKGAVTSGVMKDAGGGVAVPWMSQSAIVAKVNLVGAQAKRLAHTAHTGKALDGESVHVHVECRHGFVLISGERDETLQPVCYRKQCKEQGTSWLEGHVQAVQQFGQSAVVARGASVGAQEDMLVITSNTHDPFDSRHSSWYLGEVTDSSFSQRAGEVGGLGMMPVLSTSHTSISSRNQGDCATIWMGLCIKVVTRSQNGERVENLASLCMAVALHKVWGDL